MFSSTNITNMLPFAILFTTLAATPLAGQGVTSAVAPEASPPDAPLPTANTTELYTKRSARNP